MVIEGYKKNTLKDLLIDGRELNFRIDGDAIFLKGFGPKEMELEDNLQLLKHLPLSGNYFEKLPYNLKAANLEYWFNQKIRIEKTFRLRIGKDKILGILSDKFIPFDNHLIAELLLKCAALKGIEKKFYGDHRLGVFRLITDLDLGASKRYKAGVVIRNSEVGRSSLRADLLAWDKESQNSMIFSIFDQRLWKKTHLSKNNAAVEDLLGLIPDIVKDFSSNLGDNIDNAMNMKMEKRFLRISMRYHYRLKTALEEYLKELNDDSVKTFVNKVTNDAKDSEPFRRASLEKVAGEVVESILKIA